ncbi:uncharacterized protein LOC117327437 [Pecten maximus]|uniref:uncharacterized protein LOC117327437 n=1 Tax=Pecten maximus TaxID=6579 RepID=UPI001458FAE0|nr:uncharacterized protein LOC117327437 [Pecten maximus]
MAETQTPVEERKVTMKSTNTDPIVTTLVRQLINELELRTDTTKEATVTELKLRLIKSKQRKLRFFKNALDLKDVFKALAENHECILKALECFCINFIQINRQATSIILRYCEDIKTVVNVHKIVTSNKGGVLSRITHTTDLSEGDYQSGYLTIRNYQERNDSFQMYVSTNGQDIDSMTAAGFYATSDGNEIQCIHCDEVNNNWKPGDNPFIIHGPGDASCPNIRTSKRQESITSDAALFRPTAKHKIKMDHSRMKKRQKRMKQPPVTKHLVRVKKVRPIAAKPKHSKQSLPFLRKRKWTHRSSIKGSIDIPLFETKHAKHDNNMKEQSRTSECTSQDDRKSIPSSTVSSKNANAYTMSNGMVVDDGTSEVKPKNNMSSTEETCDQPFNITTSSEDNDSEAIQNKEISENVSHAIVNPRYKEQVARWQTYSNWTSSLNIDHLVKAGFFYTGDDDIVRCFNCDIGLAEWDREDDPWIEHARHIPECSFLKEKKGEEYIGDVQKQWSKIYSPKYPQFIEMFARIETFDSSWSQRDVRQSPEQLATAGFFYTGEVDCVCCHYCDGVLREWEPTDNPWVEHARWFPFCKFLLKIKGIDFIEDAIDNSNSEGDDFGGDLMSSPAKEIGSIFGRICDWEDRTRDDMMGTGDIKTSSDTPNDFMDDNDEKADSSINQVQKHDLNIPLVTKESTDTEVSVFVDNQDISDKDNENLQILDTLQRENARLKERSRCKICFEEEVYSVFLPCGHVIACRKCGENVTECPKCNATVNGRSKVRL